MAIDTQAQTTSARLRPYRLSVRQYLRMIDAGVFPDNARVELLGGILVQQMTKGDRHDSSLWALGEQLRDLIPRQWILREDKSLDLGGKTRPEPDLAVVPAPGNQYFARSPHARETTLVVEVADSSYADDRTIKGWLYAKAKIPVYWIVNITKRQVEVYRDPMGAGAKASYRTVEIYAEDAAVPVLIAGVEVGRVIVRDILP